MAYPYIVDTSQVIRIGDGHSNSSAATTHAGHYFFRKGATYFAFFVDPIGNTVECWKSTDYGVTWAEVNAAGHPSVYASGDASASFGWSSIACAANGDEVGVLYIDSSQALTITTFDMATELWSTNRPGGPDYSTIGAAHSAAFLLTFDLAWRSTDSKFIVIYQDANETVTGVPRNRVSWVSCTNGGTWGTGAYVYGGGLAVDYSGGYALAGASGRTHFIFAGALSAASPVHSGEIQRTLNSGDVLQTAQLFLDGTQIGLDGDGFVNNGRPKMVGTEIMYPYARFGADPPLYLTDYIEVLRAESADDPAWAAPQAVASVVMNIAGGGVRNTEADTDDAGNPYVIWGQNRTEGTSSKALEVRYSKYSAAAWSSPVEIVDATGSGEHILLCTGGPAQGGGIGIFFGRGDGAYNTTYKTHAYWPWYWQGPVVSSNGVDAGQGNVVI